MEDVLLISSGWRWGCQISNTAINITLPGRSKDTSLLLFVLPLVTPSLLCCGEHLPFYLVFEKVIWTWREIIALWLLNVDEVQVSHMVSTDTKSRELFYILLICYFHITWKITYFQPSRNDKSCFLCSLLCYPFSLCGTSDAGATVFWWCLADRVVTVNILGSLAKRQNFIWKFCLCPLEFLCSLFLLLHFLDIRSKMKAHGTQSCIGLCAVRSLADLSSL